MANSTVAAYLRNVGVAQSTIDQVPSSLNLATLKTTLKDNWKTYVHVGNKAEVASVILTEKVLEPVDRRVNPYVMTTGSKNMALGSESLFANTTGSNNPSLGKKTMKDTVKTNVLSETERNLQIQAGRMIYVQATRLFSFALPKFTWYEKLFTSKEKRELAEIVAVYAIVHVVRTKYDHYALEALTTYLNFKLQDTIVGSIDSAIFQKMLAAPTKV